MILDDSDCPECQPKRGTSSVNDSRLSAATSASRGNLGESLGVSFSLAVGPDVGPKIGNRLGSMPIDSVMNIVDTPGTRKEKKKMNSAQKEEHILRSVGSGNFSLNAQYETGLIDSVLKAKAASSKNLKNSEVGPALSAASALGIDIPKADMLGVGSNDNSMFKILKLAAFGIKALCATLRGKSRDSRGNNGYGSKTEEKLGILLSIGIDLGIIGGMLGRLKSVFDTLRGLKTNFGSISKKDLNLAGFLATLCDWIENMEYGSSLVDSFRNDSNKDMTAKALTKQLGDRFIIEGTYDSYTRNNQDFDKQYKSLAGDIDALKCDACKLGRGGINLTQGPSTIATVEFDPRTGLMRQRDGGSRITTPPTSSTITTAMKDINFQSPDSNIQYVTPSSQTHFANVSETLPKVEIADKLTQPALAGDSKLQVNDSTQFPVGSWMVLAEGTPGQECINVTGYGSLELASPLINSHPVNSTISPATDLEPVECIAGTGVSEYFNQPLDAETAPSPFTDRGVEEFFSKPVTDPSQQISLQDEPSTLPTLTPKPPITQEEISDIIGKPSVQTLSDTYNLPKEGAVKFDKATQSAIQEAKDPRNIKMDGVVFESFTPEIIYDTYQIVNPDGSLGDTVEDEWTANPTGTGAVLTNRKTVIPKPFGGDPVGPDATSVKSFWDGEEITKEELKGTPLEDADLDAVALLDKDERTVLKDTQKVEKCLEAAEEVYDKTFKDEVEKTENLVLSEQSDGIIFGAQLPILNGNQIVINSERVLIQSKTQETGIFAKRKFFVTCDDEITMNCKERFVIKTDAHTSIESPTVHLGVYTTRNHPTLKGDCTVWWLQDLCDWLRGHSHCDPHITTGSPVQQGSLAALRARLPTLLSERIFISG